MCFHNPSFRKSGPKFRKNSAEVWLKISASRAGPLVFGLCARYLLPSSIVKLGQFLIPLGGLFRASSCFVKLDEMLNRFHNAASLGRAHFHFMLLQTLVT